MKMAIVTSGAIGSRTRQELPKWFLTAEKKSVIYTLEAFQ